MAAKKWKETKKKWNWGKNILLKNGGQNMFCNTSGRKKHIYTVKALF